MKRRILYFIAQMLVWVPDSVMLRLQYFLRTRRVLHLKNPRRFTEKMQHYKAYYRNDEMQVCTDKYAVRDYVARKLGTDRYLNELYQVCDRADQIDFDRLPDRFVIKTTDGGNGKNVVVCRDKGALDIAATVKLIDSWKKIKYNILSREWAYEWTSKGDRHAKIIVEKYLENRDNADRSLDDFKFYCYDGVFRFLTWDKDRYSGHKRRFYNERLEMLEGVGNYPNFDAAVDLPANIGEMVEVAERLSTGFPFARIDLYNVDGTVVFGEITFYPASGLTTYKPDSFDFELGRYLDTKQYR